MPARRSPEAGNRRRILVAGLLRTLAALFVILLAGWAVGSILDGAAAHWDLAHFDGPITRYFVGHRVGWLTTAMRGVTALGSSVVLGGVVVVAGTALGLRRRTFIPVVFVAASFLGSALASHYTKALVGRPRPAVGPIVAVASGYSFPSGHAFEATAVYGALAACLVVRTSGTAAKRAVLLTTTLVVTLIGLSRVYLGVHWLTDVLGGWTMGAAWLAVLVRGEANSRL